MNKTILLIGAGGIALYLLMDKQPKFFIDNYDNIVKKGSYSWDGKLFPFGKGFKNSFSISKKGVYTLGVSYDGGFGTYATFNLYKNSVFVKEIQRIAL